MRHLYRCIGITILLVLVSTHLFGQNNDFKGDTVIQKLGHTVKIRVNSDYTLKLLSITPPNIDDKDIDDKPEKIQINVSSGGETSPIIYTKADAKKHFGGKVKAPTSGAEEKKDKPTKLEKEKEAAKDTKAEQKDATAAAAISKDRDVAGDEHRETVRPAVSMENVLQAFEAYLAKDPYYSENAISDYETLIDEHLTNLSQRADKDAYISEYELGTFVREQRAALEEKREEIDTYIGTFLNRYKRKDITDREDCEQSLRTEVTERLEQRETALSRLETELGITPPTAKVKAVKWLPIAICIAGVVVLGVLVTMLVKRRKGNDRARPTRANGTGSTSPKGKSEAGSDPGIVVRRKTTSILRKQSLEDVIDNPAVDASDFCDDSAVRRIYFKNSCIKAIYDMYADDLRQSDSPKEDGCMVLGRWVYDHETQEYYVSLEEVVMPGDDAIFQEYELNFGGKIKMRVKEQLRKLRVQTNLQYDLTCWVHSHPGLSVFFSNADNTVHDQLKHPTHPHFLTALVVDILTPKQDVGIFVYKRDGSISSKTDLKKMYSLEELYQWALGSERETSVQEACFDTLGHARNKQTDCCSILLNNSAIIDMKKLVDTSEAGSVNYIHGYLKARAGNTSCYVQTMTDERSIAGEDLLGCLVKTAHLSIPTLRRVLGDALTRLHFVLVYTTTDGMITSIPVAGGELSTDESYYGEDKIDDLMIWTRRKR